MTDQTPPLPFDLRAIEQPAFYLFRPYSHTDHRQMISLLEGPFHDQEKALASQDAGIAEYSKSYVAKIYRLDQLTDRQCMDRDEPVREKLLRGGRRKPVEAADLPFAGASWSPRSPFRLRLHSRRQMMMHHSLEWMRFTAGEPELAGRVPLLIELLDPANATLSP